MNVSALTAMILGQMPNGKSNGGANQNAAGAPPPPPPPPAPSAPEGGRNFKTEATRLIPFSEHGKIRERLRKGETVDQVMESFGSSLPGLQKEHIMSFAPEAWGSKPAPAPAPPKPSLTEGRRSATDIGDYFKSTVLGSSSASVINPTQDVKTGGQSSGRTDNPRVSVRSTVKHGSIDEAAKHLEKTFLANPNLAPDGYPRQLPQNERLRWIIKTGTDAVNNAPNQTWNIEGGKFVKRNEQIPRLNTGQDGPVGNVTQHQQTRFVPTFNANEFGRIFGSPYLSQSTLNSFDSLVQGGRTGNKSLGQKLEEIDGRASKSGDIWGTFAHAYTQNAGHPEAQQLILALTDGTIKLASANETRHERGWDETAVKPIESAWQTTVQDALKALEQGTTTDIKRVTKRIQSGLARDTAMSAFAGNVPFGEYKKFGYTGLNKEATTAPIGTEDLAPTILRAAGTVVQNQLANEFARTGKPGYNELSRAAGRLITAVVNNPDSPIAKQLEARIAESLKLNTSGNLSQKQLLDITNFVSMQRSNQAAKGGPKVPQYLANLVNNLNLPDVLLGGLNTNWKNDAAFTESVGLDGKVVRTPRNAADDMNAAADILENVKGTDWSAAHAKLAPWLVGPTLRNIFPRTFSEITKNQSKANTEARLESGEQYTPERGQFDLYLQGLKQAALKAGVSPSQLNTGIFAGEDMTGGMRIANLGLAGQRMLETVKQNNPDLYSELIDRALGDPNKSGKRSIPGLKFSGELTADTPLSTQLSNRIWHSVFSPSGTSNKSSAVSLLESIKDASPDFAAAIAGKSRRQVVPTTVVPSQKQAARLTEVEAPKTREFTGADVTKMWSLFQRLNDTSLPQITRKSINHQFMLLSDAYEKAIGTHDVVNAATGIAGKKGTGAAGSKENIARYILAEKDRIASKVGDSAVWQEFTKHLGKLDSHAKAGDTGVVTDVISKLNNLPQNVKLETLTLFQPNAARRAVTKNPLGMTDAEFTRFGKQATALISVFGEPKGRDAQFMDPEGKYANGERFLRKLSNPETAAATLQRVTELLASANEGLPSKGPRPQVRLKREGPTERAALASVVRGSKARKAELAGDPITAAGNSLGRSMVSNAAVIGDTGPSGAGYRLAEPNPDVNRLTHQSFMGNESPEEWLSGWRSAAGNLPASDRQAAMWLGGQLTQGKTLTQLMAYDPSATQEQNASHRDTIQRVMHGMAQASPKIGINPSTLELPSPNNGKAGVVKYNAEPEAPSGPRTPQQKRRASLLGKAGRTMLGLGTAYMASSQEGARR
jgi:hypothetical protein